MDKFIKNDKRDTILFINNPGKTDLQRLNQAVARLSEEIGRPLRVLVVADRKLIKKELKALPFNFDRIICDTGSVRQVEKALLPYHGKLIAITSWHDKDIPYFQRIIPHVPYLQTPNTDSLDWSTDKIMMRRRLRTFNKKTSPAYTIIEDSSEQSIKRVKKKVGFPLIVKPAGLASSILVSVCFHEEELEKVLKQSFRKLKSAYKRSKGRGKPAILVEQFMEGRMYSVDIYVNSRGKMYSTPLVHVTTGFSIGMNDFFGYRRLTPVTLKPHRQEQGIKVAKEAVNALALKSVSAHVELMQTDDGWKIIEVGPRIGGYRHDMYMDSFGINHTLNDIKIRLPMEPKIPKKPKGYSAVMQLYAEKEGKITKIRGINKIRKLNSFKSLRQSKKVGDKALFASHGGSSVMVVYLFNKNRSDLLADIRRLEQQVKIEVQKRTHIMKPKIIKEVTEEIINDQATVVPEEHPI